MNLRNITYGLAAIALSLGSLAATAQNVETLSSQSLSAKSVNYRVGLSHKLQLTDADIKAIGERCTFHGLPTMNELTVALKNGGAAQTKSRFAPSEMVTPVKRGAYTAADTIYSESFEGWDGSFNWIPSEWTEFSASENSISAAAGFNPTWQTYQTDGYYAPYATDGQYVAMVQYGYELYDEDSTLVQAAPEQDEWIVSPIVQSVQGTNYLIFDLGYAPISLHYFLENGEEVLDFERTTFDFEVLVTTSTRRPSNDETTYSSVFKLSDAVADEIQAAVADTTKLSALMNFTWHHFALPLSDYADQNIRVAFRYKGKQGGTVLLDGIRVSDKLPVANWAVPAGSFFYGFSQDGLWLGQETSFALLPADRESTWMNKSNADSDTFEWVYSLPEDTETQSGKSTDTELVMPANRASGFYQMPQLTAISGKRSDVSDRVGMYKFGGNSAVDDGNGNAVVLGMTNWDPTKSYWWGQIAEGKYIFGTGSEVFFGATEGLTGKVTGIANYYDQPTSPYVLTSVWVPLYKFQALTKNLRFNCTIYKVEIGDDGTVVVTDEVIANTFTTAGDVTLSSAGTYNMVFNFTDAVVINEPVMIYVDGFQQKNVLSIAPLAQPLPHDSDVNYALLSLETDNSSYILYPLEGLITNATGEGNAKSSFCIHSNAIFPYLYSVDGYIYEIPNEGGSKSFTCDTYFSPEEWVVEGLPSWVTIENTLDETNGTVAVRFVAEALPEGTEGRSANVKITSLCNEITFTLLQGTEVTGVQGIGVSKNAIARLADNTLQLNYATGLNSVAVYNATGVLIKSASLPSTGTCTLDASDLARGTYIVRFGGSAHPTVKVVK